MNVLRTRRKVISAPSPEVEAHDALISFNSLMISSETSATFRDHGAADRRPRAVPPLSIEWLDATCGGIVADFVTHHHMFW
jgi:hypothetical protein